jgi:hypothetical protein
MEKRLKEEDELVLLSIANVNYDVLYYILRNTAIEILKLKTRQMRKQEKGLGLKLVIKRRTELENCLSIV